MSQEDRVLNALIAATKAELQAATLGFEGCVALGDKGRDDLVAATAVGLRTQMLMLSARLEALQAAVASTD